MLGYKPKSWKCKLTNTRLITLLDTAQKFLMRILNHRLSVVLYQQNLMSDLQFAGLPGKSTFKPIKVINEIITNAKSNNKELWIFFQDLSKAYKRVNIYMLKQAMAHLCIPTHFIRLITQFFTQQCQPRTSKPRFTRGRRSDVSHQCYADDTALSRRKVSVVGTKTDF